MSQTIATMNTLPAITGAGSLDAYIQASNRIPVLTPEEEVSLAVQYGENDDLEAARRMVMSHLRFVIHIARGYSGYGLPLGDLIQEGNIGLMKAVKRFDPERKVRLVSFAVHWIRAEIHEYILRNWRLVKVATTKAQRKLFFNLRKNKKRLGWLSHKEVQAVAENLGVKPEVVVEMESRLSGQDVCFDAPQGRDEQDNVRPSPSAFLASENVDPARTLESLDYVDHNNNLLYQGLSELDDRSQHIIKSRWLTEKKETLQQLAEQYGVSAERIRQIEANALKKMRGSIAA